MHNLTQGIYLLNEPRNALVLKELARVGMVTNACAVTSVATVFTNSHIISAVYSQAYLGMLLPCIIITYMEMTSK